MSFKVNMSTADGKSWKLELESEFLLGKKIGDSIEGKELSADLAGYEIEITGGSDNAGFAHKSDVEGTELRRVLLTKGWGMNKKPRKEGKKKVSTPGGLRLRKTVRGAQISEKTIQINMKIVKEGSKKLPEVFPDQNKAPEPEKPAEDANTQQADAAPAEKPAETPQAEEAPAKSESDSKPESTEEKKE